MIVVVDYEMGNLGSVAKALVYLGYDAVITSDPVRIARADRLILPGVGAITYAMAQLTRKGLDEAIHAFLETGRPFLGICLGMQLMFQRSEEGNAAGLAILPGQVKRFPRNEHLKIPHMGWNRLEGSTNDLLPNGEQYYFVHSYYVEPETSSMTVAYCRHGIRFTAAIQSDQILLTQFHPEKSGQAGLTLLQQWVACAG